MTKKKLLWHDQLKRLQSLRVKTPSVLSVTWRKWKLAVKRNERQVAKSFKSE